MNSPNMELKNAFFERDELFVKVDNERYKITKTKNETKLNRVFSFNDENESYAEPIFDLLKEMHYEKMIRVTTDTNGIVCIKVVKDQEMAATIVPYFFKALGKEDQLKGVTEIADIKNSTDVYKMYMDHYDGVCDDFSIMTKNGMIKILNIEDEGIFIEVMKEFDDIQNEIGSLIRETYNDIKMSDTFESVDLNSTLMEPEDLDETLKYEEMESIKDFNEDEDSLIANENGNESENEMTAEQLIEFAQNNLIMSSSSLENIRTKNNGSPTSLFHYHVQWDDPTAGYVREDGEEDDDEMNDEMNDEMIDDGRFDSISDNVAYSVPSDDSASWISKTQEEIKVEEEMLIGEEIFEEEIVTDEDIGFNEITEERNDIFEVDNENGTFRINTSEQDIKIVDTDFKKIYENVENEISAQYSNMENRMRDMRHKIQEMKKNAYDKFFAQKFKLERINGSQKYALVDNREDINDENNLIDNANKSVDGNSFYLERNHLIHDEDMQKNLTKEIYINDRLYSEESEKNILIITDEKKEEVHSKPTYPTISRNTFYKTYNIEDGYTNDSDVTDESDNEIDYDDYAYIDNIDTYECEIMNRNMENNNECTLGEHMSKTSSRNRCPNNNCIADEYDNDSNPMCSIFRSLSSSPFPT